MPKVMLINVTHSEESRVAIINQGVLESFEIESLSREHLKGNIYKGTVHRIHPALEAAFVDIGAERDAFLPLDEVCFRNLATPAPPPTGEDGKRRPRRIRDVFKPGEEVLVQIAKEQFANKRAARDRIAALARNGSAYRTYRCEMCGCVHIAHVSRAVKKLDVLGR